MLQSFSPGSLSRARRLMGLMAGGGMAGGMGMGMGMPTMVGQSLATIPQRFPVRPGLMQQIALMPWGMVQEQPPNITTQTAPTPPPPVSIVPGYPGGGGCITPDMYGCAPMCANPLQQMLMQMQCMEQQAMYEKALHKAVIADQEQIPLGIESLTELAPGEIRVLEASPDVPMCMTRFVVDDAIITSFKLGSMKTARVELLASGTFIPSSNFRADNTQPNIQMVTVYPGTRIFLTVRNSDTNPHFFSGNWWGLPGEQPGSCLG